MTIRRDIKIAIVGASLGGLSAANVLRQLGFDAQVYELFAKGFDKPGRRAGSAIAACALGGLAIGAERRRPGLTGRAAPRSDLA
jgi:predicted NAD/FAD-dependent oxidoreductase